MCRISRSRPGLATGLLKRGAGLALWFERTVLKSFHKVSSISPEMCRRLIEKGVPRERVSEFRNWADIDAIRPMTRPSPYREQWGIATEHVALYSGNIANKQGSRSCSRRPGCCSTAIT